MRALSLLTALLVAGCAASGPSELPPSAQATGIDPVTRGKALVEANCSGCHAVGPAGDSSLPKAPPFRVLGQRYPVANLQEAFAEGISTGHPQMPQVVLEAEQVKDLIAYLESIQTPAGTR